MQLCILHVVVCKPVSPHYRVSQTEEILYTPQQEIEGWGRHGQTLMGHCLQDYNNVGRSGSGIYRMVGL